LKGRHHDKYTATMLKLAGNSDTNLTSLSVSVTLRQFSHGKRHFWGETHSGTFRLDDSRRTQRYSQDGSMCVPAVDNRNVVNTSYSPKRQIRNTHTIQFRSVTSTYYKIRIVLLVVLNVPPGPCLHVMYIYRNL